jgi:hypothetical protein
MMHDNSLAAYEAGRRDAFGDRELAILDYLFGAQSAGKTGLSDRMIMEGLGFSDMNAVRPRITELLKRGLLVEVSNIIDPITKKRVRVVAFRPSHT